MNRDVVTAVAVVEPAPAFVVPAAALVDINDRTHRIGQPVRLSACAPHLPPAIPLSAARPPLQTMCNTHCATLALACACALVAAELDRIRKLKEASINTGIGEAERMLFDKIIKAKLAAVVESAAARAPQGDTGNNKHNKRVRCSYCKKRHPGGASKCKKRRADIAASKQDSVPQTTRYGSKWAPQAWICLSNRTGHNMSISFTCRSQRYRDCWPSSRARGHASWC